MSDIDNIITKVNEIDLHGFSTDQNYKDKRKLNIFTKVEKEKTKRKDILKQAALILGQKSFSILNC